MAIIPFAVKRLIPPGSNDPRINARIGILHVDAGDNESLYEFFRDRSGGIESHGHITRAGILEQYRDTDYEADANHLANPFAMSFETQGYGDGEWTDAQIRTIKLVILWAHEAHGIPLRVVTSWDDRQGGWGYHTLFGAPGPWTPVAKSCPGAKRKVQFHTIIEPWLRAGAPHPDVQEDDMADAKTQAQLDRIEDAIERVRKGSFTRDKKVLDALDQLVETSGKTARKTQVAAIKALLEADAIDETPGEEA